MPYVETFYPADVGDGPEWEANEDPLDLPEEESQLPALVGEPTREEKDAVMKLHKNLGRPNVADLVRVLKTSRVPERVWRWAKQSFKCLACEVSKAPKSARPSMIPRSYAPNSVVAVDLLQLPSWGGSSQEWCLNAICLGTSFQMMKNKEPISVWAAFTRSWTRFLGYLQVFTS